MGKAEKAGSQHFLHFSKCFQEVSFSKSLKDGICIKGLTKDQLSDLKAKHNVIYL